MSAVDWANACRWISAVGGVILFGLSGYATVLSRLWDQRIRYLVMAGLAGLVTSTGIGALGRPFRWEIPALSTLVLLGAGATLVFIVRETRGRRVR